MVEIWPWSECDNKTGASCSDGGRLLLYHVTIQKPFWLRNMRTQEQSVKYMAVKEVVLGEEKGSGGGFDNTSRCLTSSPCRWSYCCWHEDGMDDRKDGQRETKKQAGARGSFLGRVWVASIHSRSSDMRRYAVNTRWTIVVQCAAHDCTLESPFWPGCDSMVLPI